MFSSYDRIMLGGIASITLSVILGHCATGLSTKKMFMLSLLPLGYAICADQLDRISYKRMEKRWREVLK